MNHKLLALYGLKFNPFSPELPVDAIYVPQRTESFCWRIEHAQIREGGFAMVHGDPGSGKSIVLRVLAERLKKLPDVTVGAINHPQSNLADFYRELGDVFGVPLRPSNRWGGFKALRARWLAHMESTRCRAVLLVDEAQEMTPQVLSELRLLASASFDSQSLLCIVMAGDVCHVGEVAFQLFLVIVPQRHLPGPVVGILAGIEQFPGQSLVVGQQAGCHVAERDHTCAGQRGDIDHALRIEALNIGQRVA